MCSAAHADLAWPVTQSASTLSDRQDAEGGTLLFSTNASSRRRALVPFRRNRKAGDSLHRPCIAHCSVLVLPWSPSFVSTSFIVNIAFTRFRCNWLLCPSVDLAADLAGFCLLAFSRPSLSREPPARIPWPNHPATATSRLPPSRRRAAMAAAVRETSTPSQAHSSTVPICKRPRSNPRCTPRDVEAAGTWHRTYPHASTRSDRSNPRSPPPPGAATTLPTPPNHARPKTSRPPRTTPKT